MKPSLLIGHKTHQELHSFIKEYDSLTISGLSNETAKTLVLSHLLSTEAPQALYVTEGDSEVEGARHWFSFFECESHTLAPVVINNEINPGALQSFLLFMQGAEGLFVCSRETWDEGFPSFKELKKNSLSIHSKKTLSFVEFIESLIKRGYSHGEDIHLVPGEYRRIGDVLEIFPIQSSCPYRITFEIDQVESIEKINKDNPSNILGKTDALEIFPIIYEEQEQLASQFPPKTLLVLDDQDDIEIPHTSKVIRYSAFPEGAKKEVHLRYLSVLKFYTLSDLLNDIKDKLNQKWTLIIVSKRVQDLEGIFKEERIPFSREKEQKGAVLLQECEADDLLPHSVQNPDLKCALITDREIFSLKKTAKHRGVQKVALDFITSLSTKDYVVHMEHGIGSFEGMTQKEIDGTIREYLELTYAEVDKLFIPVDQADKLSKFVYEEGNEPSLSRLGASDWKKVSEKMKKETKEIAHELLALYAKRANAKGFKYEDDSRKQKKLEESFPYQETPGQLKAIEDIKKDMEDDHPMDRLVCGDVGFGKTEVAIRASFKAVQSGKQVAVIAPITILVDQHYQNFSSRMEDLGVRIDMLSRFKKPKEQRETLERLRKGDVDIVIGTHRLIQKDVKFHNLGLVIIDEEQRFGVKQKEQFKEMRASVDILTLTATPIPRTLNLGLHKLRDISTITTPPPGRLPIITEVRKYSDHLIRQTVLVELKRKGQIFILHNRVETIDAFTDKLRKLIPEAKFVVGHGQLKPEDLEERIFLFKSGEYDVLVSSTIIENGIDLPRANTLIVNEAEKFGLSQLYQLRGRVGRSKLQAYAYFLYHSQRLKDDAKKRLRAIVEACELGSGFQVAMRDLEIRGAGEILGAQQSGTMQTVGVSHYLRMLKMAIQEIKSGKKGELQEEENIEILLPIEALLPSFYIPDTEERISLYQKLAGSSDEEILKEFKDDLKEEYGSLPQQVENLFKILYLKMTCRRAGVIRVKKEDSSKDGGEIVLSLNPRVTASEIMQILRVNPQWRISGSTLRIAEQELERKAGKKDWVPDLTKEIEALIKQKKGKKNKK